MKRILIASILLMATACHDKFTSETKYLASPVPGVVQPVSPIAGLSCSLYDLSLIQPSVLPTFTTIPSQALLGTVSSGSPVSTYVLTGAINFPNLSSILAPSGSVLTSWIALDCHGSFDVMNAASYTFKLNSDDGSALYVDGLRVINNDGLHGATLKSGSMTLSKGTHTVELQYFEGNGPAVLQLFSNIAVEFYN